MTLQPGDRLGPYEIHALIGAGGMGEVYRGHDVRLRRDVALKVVSPKVLGDPASRRRFELESQAASALNHPSIVTIYDVGETNGVSWIAMEWIDGRTLRQAIANGPQAVRDAASIVRQIADGLAEVHAKGIVHRDLKPENIMLTKEGRCKVLDFGLARQTVVDSLEQSMVNTVAAPGGATFTGTILGTVGYMSPEQAAGQPVDFRSDQFALGLVAYEILTGRRAFDRASTIETLWAIMREEPDPIGSLRNGVPEPFQAAIARCLAKRPDDRFPATRDLAAALESLVVDPPPSEASVDASIPIGRQTSNVTSRLGRAVGLTLGAVAVVTLGFTAWMRLDRPRPSINSLAILPFENAARDPQADYLVDGLTESLIDQMALVPSLQVRAHAAVLRFKETTDPQAAGRQLDVGAVLTGTVSRRGTQLAVSVELVEVATGTRLWGRTYEGSPEQLLPVQDRMASDIADGLRLRLSGQEKDTLARYGTTNPVAYELFLKARYLLHQESEEGDVEAQRLFLEAIDKDPRFVDAHLGVASTFARSAGNGSAPPAEAWSHAETELRKVLALDPGNIPARASLAVKRLQFGWDWAGAESELNEVSADAKLLRGPQVHAVALYYWARGRPEEGIALLERALRVDPNNLESKMMVADLLAQAGRLDQAVSAYKALQVEEPSDSRAFFGLADVLIRRGETKGAIEALRKAYQLAGEDAGVEALSQARTEKDYESAQVLVARNQLTAAEAAARTAYVSPLELARLWVRTGDRERAFQRLEGAVAERSPMLILLKADRAWDPIRGDPRFAAIVRTIGIP